MEGNINLTEELTRAVAEHPNEPVRLIDPVTKRQYVLVSADIYDRLSAAYDDSPWTDEERDALRAEAVDTLGWEGMEAYQSDGP
ncbi:MAG: hypothetical protein JWO38_7135 [Gemmataceae bacterium]|nr:hypothetical protein [Gemmataceae bacterium]